MKRRRQKLINIHTAEMTRQLLFGTPLTTKTWCHTFEWKQPVHHTHKKAKMKMKIEKKMFHKRHLAIFWTYLLQLDKLHSQAHNNKHDNAQHGNPKHRMWRFQRRVFSSSSLQLLPSGIHFLTPFMGILLKIIGVAKEVWNGYGNGLNPNSNMWQYFTTGF